MGAEVTICASKFRDKDNENSTNPLEAMAKSERIARKKSKNKKIKNIEDIPVGLPRKQSESQSYDTGHHHHPRDRSYQKRKSSIQRYKERKLRKKRRSQKMLPISQEL